jgi:ATP-dependent Clp protease ATP-binding subunit ClpC
MSVFKVIEIVFATIGFFATCAVIAIEIGGRPRELAMRVMPRRSGSRFSFTGDVRDALALARRDAHDFGHEYVEPEHILLGILETDAALAKDLLRNSTMDMGRLAADLRAQMTPGRSIESGDVPYSSAAKQVLAVAMHEARSLGSTYVGAEHLLLGVLESHKSVAAKLLTGAGTTLENARDALRLRRAS